MNHYQKPIISIDTGMAEGIYAASGATQNTVSFGNLIETANWGNTSGQLKFSANLSSLAGSKLKLIVTFNTDLTAAWGGGSSASGNGKNATFEWYQAPDTAELYIQVNTNPSSVQITGYTYTQA